MEQSGGEGGRDDDRSPVGDMERMSEGTNSRVSGKNLKNKKGEGRRSETAPPALPAALLLLLFVQASGAWSGTPVCSTAVIRLNFELGAGGRPEPNIVIAVRRQVVVAVRGAAVLRTVVPATAAIHAVRALRRAPFEWVT